MNKYNVIIKIQGQAIHTSVFADSPVHARLILEYQFGINCLIGKPTLIYKETSESDSFEESLKTIKPLKPKTPQQLTIDTLKKQKDQASDKLKAERERQKLQKSQHVLFNLSRPTV